MISAAFQSVYSGLPRYSPGSDLSTRRALSLLPDLPSSPRVFDLGCGAGRQTLEVARQLKTKIVAVDLHQLYLDELTEAARREGLDHFVETRCASMDDLNEPAASIDLIWAEGAAYNIGVENALNLWRPLLRRGGAIAFTELTWLTDDPPAEAVTFWAAAYADMTTVAANRLRVKRAGYEVLSSFALPVDDWKAYYDPLRRRLAELQPQAHGRPELADVIHATEEEIRIFEEFGDHYGYVFFIARGPEL